MSTKVVPKVYHRRLLCKEKLFHFSVQTSKWELMNSFNKVQKEVSLCRQLFSKVWQHPELQFFTRLGPSSTEQGAGSSACALLVGRRLEKFHEVERRNERLGWFLVEVARIKIFRISNWVESVIPRIELNRINKEFRNSNHESNPQKMRRIESNQILSNLITI